MKEIRTIEIDFDVHKVIEAERRSFSETANTVLRRLLRLPESDNAFEPAPASSGNEKAWSEKGVTLPHGTEVRMSYNGQLYEGQIRDGKWVIGNKEFNSPSGAASGIAVTKRGKRTRLDGWMYWEVLIPSESNWTPLKILRRNAVM